MTARHSTNSDDWVAFGETESAAALLGTAARAASTETVPELPTADASSVQQEIRGGSPE